MNNSATGERRPNINGPDNMRMAPGDPGFWMSVAWLVFFIVAQLVGLGIAIGYKKITTGNIGDIENQGPTVVVGGLILGGLIVLISRWTYFKRHTSTNMTNGKKLFIVALGLLIMELIASSLYEKYIIPGMDMQPDIAVFMDMLKSGFGGTLAVFIGGAVIAPIVEEVLFRGQIQTAINTRLEDKGYKNPHLWAIGITAAIFGAFHFQPLAFPLLMMVGIILGWLRYKTGSLLAPIAFHMAANAIALTMLVIETRT